MISLGRVSRRSSGPTRVAGSPENERQKETNGLRGEKAPICTRGTDQSNVAIPSLGPRFSPPRSQIETNPTNRLTPPCAPIDRDNSISRKLSRPLLGTKKRPRDDDTNPISRVPFCARAGEFPQWRQRDCSLTCVELHCAAPNPRAREGEARVMERHSRITSHCFHLPPPEVADPKAQVAARSIFRSIFARSASGAGARVELPPHTCNATSERGGSGAFTFTC